MLRNSPDRLPRSGSKLRRKIGPLQRQLRQGEYGLFRRSPVLESNFIQISKHGGPVDIHNQEEIVTVGITATSREVLIPDVMLLARPIFPSDEENFLYKSMYHIPCPVTYELRRLFPLCLLKISVHNAERQQLRIKLANGRTFYLQVYGDPEEREHQFDSWVQMIHLLWPPTEIRSPQLQSPQSSTEKSVHWDIHTATQSVSDVDNNIKKKKKKSSSKKAVKPQTPPPVLPLLPAPPPPPSLPPPPVSPPPPSAPPTPEAPHLVSAQVAAGDTFISYIYSSPTPVSPPPPSAPPAPESPHLVSAQLAAGDSPISYIYSSEVLDASGALETSQKEKSPDDKSQAVEKPEIKSSPQSERKHRKGHSSRSRSGHRGVSRKPSRFAALLRACGWGKKKKSRHAKKH